MIETKTRKLFIEQADLPDVAPFCKLNKNRIYKVNLIEGEVQTKEGLARLLCDASPSKKPVETYEVIEEILS